MSDFLIGLIRTWVPIATGAVIAWLVGLGILDPEGSTEVFAALVTTLTAITQGVYYFLVRLMAEKWSVFGYLLGVNQAPAYTKGVTASD